jgi:uncharacterized Rmd1/YagE family protein
MVAGGELSDEDYYDDMPLAEMDTLHRAAATIADLGIRHIFCFQYGCLVFWGMTPEEEKQFIDLVCLALQNVENQDWEFRIPVGRGSLGFRV